MAPPTGASSSSAQPVTTPNPPPAPPPPYERPDLSDLLDRLHDDLGVEAAPAPVAPDAPLTDARDLERPKHVDTVIIESTGGIEFDPTFASFPARLLGGLVDAVALALAMAPGLTLAITADSPITVLVGVVLTVVGFFAMNVWYARSIASKGQWLGNRVAKTRVVDSRNGHMIDVAHAGARFAVRHLVSVVFFAGCVPALFDGQRQTFHDKFANSVVTTRPRETWSADDQTA